MSKRFLTAVLFALTAVTLISAQAPAPKGPTTPWGDPDLSGVYSNDDETGTPMERPAAFDGRRIEDITPAELASLINKQRTEQFNAGVAGTEFAGGLRPPTHLIFDSFERKNSRPWLVDRSARRQDSADDDRKGSSGCAVRSAASAPTRIRSARSTATRTWASTTAASRAASRTR